MYNHPKETKGDADLEIIYRQTNADIQNDKLYTLGIERCYLKHITVDRDRLLITKKRHHHSEFEIHIIKEGSQTYEVDGKEISVPSENFLLIPPYTSHTLLSSAPNTEKYAFTFCAAVERVNLPNKYTLCNMPRSFFDSIAIISDEKQKKLPFSHEIIASRALECLLLILREVGAEPTQTQNVSDAPDQRYLMAKQYINDNVHTPLTVPEVADYCCISPKQLTRIFLREEGIHISEYIRRTRCKQIERLLSNPALSLRAISEEMGFANEYYFNTYFKKHSGMTPGTYRRTMK